LTFADTNSSPQETGYACKMSLDNSTWSSPYQVGAGVTTMTAAQALGSALAGSTLYYFQCAAIGDGGTTTNDSAYTGSFSFTTASPAGTGKGGMLLLRGGRHGGPGPGSQKR
jgi:hypothetical protein